MNDPITIKNVDGKEIVPDTKTRAAMWHFYRKPYKEEHKKQK